MEIGPASPVTATLVDKHGETPILVTKTVQKHRKNSLDYIVYTYNDRGKLETSEVRPHKLDKRV